MTKTITVSTSVFAEIWANRRDGEETEDAILGRLLGCNDGAERERNQTDAADGSGVFDSRNNVRFPKGFELFRNYKRKEYKAIAHNGVWVCGETGKRFPTLHQLNQSIVSGNENVWNGNWKYRTPDGAFRSIDSLRV